MLGELTLQETRPIVLVENCVTRVNTGSELLKVRDGIDVTQRYKPAFSVVILHHYVCDKESGNTEKKRKDREVKERENE